MEILVGNKCWKSLCTGIERCSEDEKLDDARSGHTVCPLFSSDTTEGEELATERHARDDTPPNLAHSHLQVVVVADVTTRQRDVIGAGRRDRCAVEELKTTDALQPAVGDPDARRELTQTGDAEERRSVRRPEHHTS